MLLTKMIKGAWRWGTCLKEDADDKYDQDIMVLRGMMEVGMWCEGAVCKRERKKGGDSTLLYSSTKNVSSGYA